MPRTAPRLQLGILKSGAVNSCVPDPTTVVSPPGTVTSAFAFGGTVTVRPNPSPAVTAQLTLKYGVDRVTKHGHSGIVLSEPIHSAARVAREPFIWAGLILFAVSAVVWIVVLSRVSLSFAYPFAAITYIVIVLFDGFAFGMLLFVLSVGLSVTLGLMNFINLAHGAFGMLGGYLAVTAMRQLGFPFLLALPTAVRGGARGIRLLGRTRISPGEPPGGGLAR
jgi:hypothetical protein